MVIAAVFVIGMLVLAMVLWIAAINKENNKERTSLEIIPDQYKTLSEVNNALRNAGLESSNLIVAIDFTKSNESQGARTFGGLGLHSLVVDKNPYEQVIEICAQTLMQLDDDMYIPCFGFGDSTTKGRSCFSFTPDDERGCYGFLGILEKYRQIVPDLQFSGPTNFAPAIHAAIDIVKETKEFHILVIICDGQVTSHHKTRKAIVEACNYPLSIIIVGVGDGNNDNPQNPWEEMEIYDDGLPDRKWDNVQFVPFNTLVGEPRGKNKQFTEQQKVKFAVAAMQELPDQYKCVKNLGLI